MKTTTPKLDAAWLEAKKRANEAYEQRDALGMLEAETTADLLARKRDLVEHATRIGERLLATAARVEAEPDNHHSANSAGEVQGAGLDVDRLCAEIAAFRDVLAGVGMARKAADRPADGSPS